MLVDSDSVLQFWRCAGNVTAVTATHVLMYDIAPLKGRHGILVHCSSNRFGGEYQRNFRCHAAITHYSFDFFLEFQRSAID